MKPEYPCPSSRDHGAGGPESGQLSTRSTALDRHKPLDSGYPARHDQAMFTLVLALTTAALAPNAAPPNRPGPERRALAYLAREVPAWHSRKRCYSCHNNGDAARALYIAVRLGRSVPRTALDDTTAWLQRPDRWDDNGGKGPYSDKKLARLQFAATLAEAHRAGLARDKRGLDRAARLVAAQQDEDGSWRVVPDETIGSPATHGPALATALARLTLIRLGGERHKEAIAKADRWLRTAPINTVLDAAGVLLGLGVAKDPAALKQKRLCLEVVRKGEKRSSGWGPYVRSPAEVFDTAVVLLALADQERTAEVSAWLKRGRAFLLASQEPDGSWTETTRPSGSESYAQRLSTTGWAARALLATAPRPGR
jgi:hypothetical protein